MNFSKEGSPCCHQTQRGRGPGRLSSPSPRHFTAEGQGPDTRAVTWGKRQAAREDLSQEAQLGSDMLGSLSRDKKSPKSVLLA